ncbi:MAG: selenocysteine-specific translation elongation factor [bacterium]|nr:selenocysteine-specific translation elongation factor [bacterium]
MIIATAGHVDHGKTSLVAALTGVDTDRLAEEKRRGLTIDLGYAWLDLPCGQRVGFIDVPGHERFVRNMVAGLSRVDLGLLAVAADDGVMPQTVEHVAVLSLLGVRQMVIAITKADRAAGERIARTAVAAEMLAHGHGIDVRAMIATSVPDQRGLSVLRRHLGRAARAMPEPSPEGGFRLAVDRSFIMKGAGLVVTGTVCAGEVGTGDALTVLPAGLNTRARALHGQARPVERAVTGERASINLAGLSRDDVRRGDWIVTPGILAPSHRIDAMVTILESERRAFSHWQAVHVHHGTGHVTGRVALLEESAIAPGGSGLAQLRLDGPLVPAWNDRLLLRDVSARRTIGGARVLDAAGPARGRARRERLSLLRAVDRDDHEEALDVLVDIAAAGFDPVTFFSSRNLDSGACPLPGHVRRFTRDGHEHVIHERHWNALADQLLDAVDGDHARRQDRLGPDARELRLAVPGSADSVLVGAIIDDLCHRGTLMRRGVVVYRPGRKVEPAARDRALWTRAEAAIEVASGSPPSLHPLAATLEMTPDDLRRFLERMAAFGLVVRIARNRYLTPRQIAGAESAVQDLLRTNPDGIGVGDLRDALGIGRNHAVDLLEYLDHTGITWRRGTLRFSPALKGDPERFPRTVQAP